MAMSVTMLNAAAKYQKASKSTHLPFGIFLFQKNATGRHEHAATIRAAIPYEKTIVRSTHAAIRVL